MEPDALIAGPRGRRLILECAQAMAIMSDPAQGGTGWAMNSMLFQLAHQLDPTPGGVAFLSSESGPSRPAPVHAVADFPELLGSLEPVPLGDRALAIALRASVDSARYWQEPDGTDALASSPELTEPLARIAASLATSTFTSPWSAPLDITDQWSILASDEVREPAPNAADELGRWRAAVLEEEATAIRDRPRDPAAMFGGNWWSTPPRSRPRSTGNWASLGPIGLWLVEDSLGWTDMGASPIRIPSEPTVRVFEIDGPGAWVELAARYPLEVTAARRHDWYRTTGGTGRWLIPDWSRVAADLDAVHLSIAGYLATAGRELPIEDGMSTVLAGWDPDATYWLMDGVGTGDEVGWHRDHEDWHRVGS